MSDYSQIYHIYLQFILSVDDGSGVRLNAFSASKEKIGICRHDNPWFYRFDDDISPFFSTVSDGITRHDFRSDDGLADLLMKSKL